MTINNILYMCLDTVWRLVTYVTHTEGTLCNVLEFITITQHKSPLTNETHVTLQFHGRSKTRAMRVAHCRGMSYCSHRTIVAKWMTLIARSGAVGYQQSGEYHNLERDTINRLLVHYFRMELYECLLKKDVYAPGPSVCACTCYGGKTH
jgi:hypothetical protein